MVWRSLQNRLNELPLILCGPILRRTEPSSVTVWVALKEERTVTLGVYSRTEATDLALRLVGTRTTVKLGDHLYVVAVTAEPIEASKELVSGELYFYNLFFSAPQLSIVPTSADNLQSPTILTAEYSHLTNLFYPEYGDPPHMGSDEIDKLLNPKEEQLPSFSLPPEDLDKLRIVHGSCRKLHNPGLDAMPAIDEILQVHWSAPIERPHMLFLTGDQIYADDIASTVLFLLEDAGNALLGWQEDLPDIDENDKQSLKPGRRKEIVEEKCGFTTEDGESHLLRLGEFYAAYLFAWSPTLWPLDGNYPEFEKVYPGEPRQVISAMGVVPSKKFDSYQKNKDRLRKLMATLHEVRRALANIPTYMIFDDHEVTDDWNMTHEWCEKTLTKPLGHRVIQNALLAYAIFQAWGNTPAQFAENQNSPGETLLTETATWSKTSGQDIVAGYLIRDRLGLPPQGNNIFTNDLLNGDKILIRPEGALNWHYSIKWPKFEVIVLDTRTRHAYPGGKTKPASLLSASAFKDQIDDQQNPGTLVTFVVAPTPVITFPFFRIAIFLILLWLSDTYKFDLPDHWQNQKKSFELLIAKLASRAPALNNKRQNRVVILTGDIHFTSSSRLQYWADKPFTENATISTLPTQAVFAQFSASSFKKQDPNTKYLHSHGYEFNDVGFVIREILPGLYELLSNIPVLSTIVDLINRSPKSTYCFGSKKTIQESGKTEPIMHITGSLAKILDAWKFVSNASANLIPKPDWRYRIDFILAEDEVREPAPFAPREVILPAYEEDRIEALKNYLAMAKNHEDYARKWGHGKEIVGVNNVCEISFDWKPDQKKTVTQKTWWRLKSKSDREAFLKAFPLSKFSVSLEFDDSRYERPNIPNLSIQPPF